MPAFYAHTNAATAEVSARDGGTASPARERHLGGAQRAVARRGAGGTAGRRNTTLLVSGIKNASRGHREPSLTVRTVHRSFRPVSYVTSQLPSLTC